MQKQIPKYVHCCDSCGEEDIYPNKCVRCGVEMCTRCSEEHGVEYRHAVYFAVSGDGFYCKKCDTTLTKLGNDKLHAAYKAVAALRAEYDAWAASFKQRKDAAEKVLAELRT